MSADPNDHLPLTEKISVQRKNAAIIAGGEDRLARWIKSGKLAPANPGGYPLIYVVSDIMALRKSEKDR